MLVLEQEYILRGRSEWIYKQVKRQGDVVMSEMHRIEAIEKNGGVMDKSTRRGYEVFIVQKYPERPRPDGKGMIPAKELPPPDFSWGQNAFSISGKDEDERAEERFNELIERIKQRNENRQAKAGDASSKDDSGGTKPRKQIKVDKQIETTERAESVGDKSGNVRSKGTRVSKNNTGNSKSK